MTKSKCIRCHSRIATKTSHGGAYDKFCVNILDVSHVSHESVNTGLAQLKINNVSSFTQPHVAPNLNDFCFFCGTQKEIFLHKCERFQKCFQ